MKNILFILALVVFVGIVSAAPVTQAVTGITADRVTFNALGGVGTGWFQWGGVSGNSYIWATPNQTVAGAFSDYQQGNPMISGNTYYVIACDTTGCGNQVTFVVPAATPLNQTYFGEALQQIRRSGLNITQTLPLIITPYTNQLHYWTWALLFFFIFAGWWMRMGDITLPMFVALIFGSALIWGASSGLGIPPEAMDIGIGLIIAAIGGFIFSLFTK